MDINLIANHIKENAEGYEFIKTYVDRNKKHSRSVIEIKCPNNHTYEVLWAEFRRGARCRECNPIAHTYEYVKNFIEIESGSGCTLKSDNYLNNTQKLLLQCACGELFLKSFGNFKQGQRTCPICAKERIKEKLKLPLEKIYAKVRDEGYVFIKFKDSYKNGKSKLVLECKNNHIFEIKYDDLRSGCGCYICNVGIVPTIEECQEEFQKHGFVLMEECYINNSTPMKYICNKHPDVTQTKSWGSLQQGTGCYFCGLEKISESKKGG